VGNAVVVAAARRVQRSVKLRAGELAPAFREERRVFHRLVFEAVLAGESTGQLDETLTRTAAALRAEGERKLRRVVQTLAGVVSLLVAGYIGYVIVSFWAGLYAPLEELL
jgi:type II secretory pathway component PulF